MRKFTTLNQIHKSIQREKEQEKRSLEGLHSLMCEMIEKMRGDEKPSWAVLPYPYSVGDVIDKPISYKEDDKK